MPLPLPTLDTRRWSELVEQGRCMIPSLAPAWTDHNTHDPGVTLIELGAWLTEQQWYRANRITDRYRRKFLTLLGIEPLGPRPASVLLEFSVAAAATAPVALPAGVMLATEAGDTVVPFATDAPFVVSDAALVAVQSFDGRCINNLSRAILRGVSAPAFGEDPLLTRGESPALYLGFDAPLPTGMTTTIWFIVNEHDASYQDMDARQQLADEQRRRRSSCRPIEPSCRPCARARDHWCTEDQDGEPPMAHATPSTGDPILTHHSAVTVWDVFRGGRWQALRATEVDDRTRSLTLNGPVRVTPAHSMERCVVGEDPRNLYYLRCRLAQGFLDAAPVLRLVAPHAVRAEQRRLLRGTLPIAAGVTPKLGEEPVVGASNGLQFELDASGEVTSIAMRASEEAPQVMVLDYAPSSGAAKGTLSITLTRVGEGDDLPHQEVAIAAEPLSQACGELWINRAGQLTRCRARCDLDASLPTDRDYVLDEQGKSVRFGDGERGRTVPAGAAIFALGATTLGMEGNVAAGSTWRLDGADDAVNKALLGVSPTAVASRLSTIRNRLSGRGGDAPEDVRHALGRALESLWGHERLVELAESRNSETLDQIPRADVVVLRPPARATTALDFERIALSVPGTRIARARASAGHNPAYPCLHAAGTVTVFVLPYLPLMRPLPSLGLIETVRRYLEYRRVLGLRLIVAPPRYVEVAVHAQLQFAPGSDREAVLASAAVRLDAFFHPLTGGERGLGWPFGRDVYRTEVMQVLAETPGVEAVSRLELVTTNGVSRCGNVCIGEGSLVAAGAHVLAGQQPRVDVNSPCCGTDRLK